MNGRRNEREGMCVIGTLRFVVKYEAPPQRIVFAKWYARVWLMNR